MQRRVTKVFQRTAETYSDMLEKAASESAKTTAGDRI
jgi:hypothetical protein